MPQLDLFSYASVVWWLLLAFFYLYFLSLKLALPNLYKVLFVRSTKLKEVTLSISLVTKEVVVLEGLYSSLLQDCFETFKEIFRVLKVFTGGFVAPFPSLFECFATELELLLQLTLVSKAATSVIETPLVSKKFN